MKVCSKCGQSKPQDQFFRHGSGRRPECKACTKVQHQEYTKRPEVRAAKYAYHKAYNASLTPEQRGKYYHTVKKWQQRTPRHAISQIRSNAKIRRPGEAIPSLEDLLLLFAAQNGECAVSGIKLTWQKKRITPTSISLDRIDNELGYAADNIRFVCFAVNAFKNSGTDSQMLEMARAIVARAT